MSYFAVIREAGPAWTEGGIYGQPGVDEHAAERLEEALLYVDVTRPNRSARSSRGVHCSRQRDVVEIDRSGALRHDLGDCVDRLGIAVVGADVSP